MSSWYDFSPGLVSFQEKLIKSFTRGPVIGIFTVSCLSKDSRSWLYLLITRDYFRLVAKHLELFDPTLDHCLQVWQYVTLMRRIYLIDCPGVVYPSGDSETEIILKGVVRNLFIAMWYVLLCASVLWVFLELSALQVILILAVCRTLQLYESTCSGLRQVLFSLIHSALVRKSEVWGSNLTSNVPMLFIDIWYLWLSFFKFMRFGHLASPENLNPVEIFKLSPPLFCGRQFVF